jgi:hypothetical protein
MLAFFWDLSWELVFSEKQRAGGEASMGIGVIGRVDRPLAF